jgi:cytochrome c-type biogenesis protein CcmH/NrfG
MKTDAIAFGVAGIVFGVLAGWILGFQYASSRQPAPAAAVAQPPAASAPVVDEAKVKAFRSVAEREPANAEPRVQLGNLYFDAERYDEAIPWYSEALKISPSDVNVSTDLGVSYYYSNQPDRALAQFDHSLKLDPKHTKTILNVGIVKAFGKQDLAGAQQAWEQVIKLSPDSAEGQAARRALDSLRSAHAPTGGTEKPASQP